VKRRLADWLISPATGEELRLRVDDERDGEILEGELTSSDGQRYPITAGIPRLVPPVPEDDRQRETEEAFSTKWRRAKDYGHDDQGRSVYLSWYLQRYRFGTLEGLREFLGSKKRILDAGTGVGRDTRFYAENSGAEVFGVDISRGVDSAYGHLKAFPNVHVLQADLRRLPFPPEFFDFIACDHVLHLTGNTEESFHRLVTRLAPGGDLSIYVYRKKAPIRELADDYVRDSVDRMSEEEAWRFAEQLTELGRVLSEIGSTVIVPDIPALGIRGGPYDVQRFVYWHMLKCFWNPALRQIDNVATNFDWYRPRNARRHTADEVRGWFADAGLEIVTFDEGDAGISVRGRRPGGLAS
jgi:SAM-dependent methyltransferase